MHQLAGQPTALVESEVTVLQQQRHLVRWSLGQPEVTFALVADDPQSRQPGVYVEPSDAHHVVVVPEQRRALVHRVVKYGELAGCEEVLGPAVVHGRCQATVQVHDRVSRQRRGVRVRRAAAQTGTALHRHTVGVDLVAGHRYDDGQPAVKLVAPLDADRVAALSLDRRAWERAVVAPHTRPGQIAMEAV